MKKLKAEIGKAEMLTPIKPLGCPFCGGFARIHRNNDHLPEFTRIFWTVSCPSKNDCTSWPLAIGNTRAEAIANWNRRAAK